MPLFKTSAGSGLLWFCFCLVIFGQSLGLYGIEYRDDEIFYYQASREMASSGNLLSPTYFNEDRFQKPVLFYWFIIAAFKIFGVNWFAARLVSVVFAGLSTVVTWVIADNLWGRKTANFSAAIVMTIPLFFRHAKNAVPDMALNFFIVLSLWAALRFIQNSEQARYRILFFISIALGFLIKGFAALIVPCGTVLLYLLFIKNRALLKKFGWLSGFAIFLIMVLPWFFYMINLHGKAYLDYMLVHETQNRLVGGSFSLLFQNFYTEFLSHAGFYVKTLFTYFMPWTVLFVLGVPFLFVNRANERDSRIKAVTFLSIWLLLVFFFFSSLHVIISHYVLVLSTPFAILTALSLTQQYELRRGWIFTLLDGLRKYYCVFCLGAGFLAFALLVVFFAGYHVFFLGLFVLVFLGLMIFVIKGRPAYAAALSLSLLLAIVYSQTGLIEKAGVSAHATLGEFADAIKSRGYDNAVIALGSHDLHEKEFQVFFDKPVKKSAQDTEQFTVYLLNDLFKSNGEVYCLITEYGYNRYLKGKDYPLTVLMSRPLIRKRMRLDQDFFKALVTFDRETVSKYLKENVLLVYQESNG